ncbi:MAG: ion channel [Terriglobia bacterium]
MEEIGSLSYEVIGYCATCGKEFGRARKDTLGRRIRCAENCELAQVILADKSAKWWLRREEWLLKWQKYWSPFPILRCVHNRLTKLFRRREPKEPLPAGHFLLVSFVLIVIALILEGRFPQSWTGWAARSTFGLLLFWRLIDIFFSNTSITFTSRVPASPLRSVVFSFVAFVQIVLCFGYFYSFFAELGVIGPKESHTFSVMEAVYYSFGTIATVGYGSLEPKHCVGQLLVASELVLGLYFIVIILAQVSAWALQSKVELGTFSWDELKADTRD